MKQYLTIIAILALGLISCAVDESLDQTIVVKDEQDPNLPAYTEWGYNSFGAKYERTYFLASNTWAPCKITTKNGQVNFILQGSLSGTSIYDKTILTISFPAPEIRQYADLLLLHERSFNLKDASCSVRLEYGIENQLLNLIAGNITFKRAQQLRVDDKNDRIILSGTFAVQFLNNDRPESFSRGRFDLGLIEQDFYDLAP
ncbi:MAG: hypothetical protein LBG77_05360 [Dysgonamonadaceae bacterium]|jgi:hypothetical protein|nr:hypothetical protein [Dysgonamonadaceae bacterium]